MASSAYDAKLDKARLAVRELYNDSSVSRADTREALQEVMDEIVTYLDCLDIDDRREEEAE